MQRPGEPQSSSWSCVHYVCMMATPLGDTESFQMMSCLTKETQTYFARFAVPTVLHVWHLQEEKVKATHEVQVLLLILSCFHAGGEGLFL